MRSTAPDESAKSPARDESQVPALADVSADTPLLRSMDAPRTVATTYDMVARQPRTVDATLSEEEWRYIQLLRSMAAKKTDADGGRITEVTARHIGDRVQLRVERAY